MRCICCAALRSTWISTASVVDTLWSCSARCISSCHAQLQQSFGFNYSCKLAATKSALTLCWAQKNEWQIINKKTGREVPSSRPNCSLSERCDLSKMSPHLGGVAAHQLCKSPTVKLPRNLCENFIRQGSMRHEDAAGSKLMMLKCGSSTHTHTGMEGYEEHLVKRDWCWPVSVWHTVNEEKWPKVFYKCFALRAFCLCAARSAHFSMDLATPEHRKYICHKGGTLPPALTHAVVHNTNTRKIFQLSTIKNALTIGIYIFK